MPLRLILAFALSLAVHGVLLFQDIFKRQPVAPPRPALQALLRLPPKPEAPPAEPLLKNTIDSEEAPRIAKHVQPPPAKKPQPMSRTTVNREVQALQRKLSKNLFYPPLSFSQGIEGEVRLIIKFDAHGAIEDVNIAASSGHADLDNAAIKAAWAMGQTGVTSRELILPVIFRLQ